MTGAWTQDYRALRPRSLAWQLGVLVLAEWLLFRNYDSYEALFHWSTHFLVGIVFTALVLTARLLLQGRPRPRYLLLSVLGFHLLAIVPDLLFRGGAAHSPWMDVFLAHLAVHYLPGGELSWLVIALLTTASYVLFLTRWLRRRHVTARQDTSSRTTALVGAGR